MYLQKTKYVFGQSVFIILTVAALASMPSKSARELEEERQFVRAQRLAKRTRAATACVPCKAKKARCSDYRPCARCKRSTTELCVDSEDASPQNMADTNEEWTSAVARTAPPVQTSNPPLSQMLPFNAGIETFDSSSNVAGSFRPSWSQVGLQGKGEVRKKL